MSSFNFHFESHIRAPFIPFIVVARALRLSADCSFPGFGFGFGLVRFGCCLLLVLLLDSAMDRLQFRLVSITNCPGHNGASFGDYKAVKIIK